MSMTNKSNSKLESNVLKDVYNKDYYVETMKRKNKLNLNGRFIRDDYALLNVKKGDIVLDIGCGCGECVVWCASQGAFSYGIDYSPESIKFCNSLNLDKSIKDKVNFIEAAATKLPFKDSFFDKVYCMECIEHLNIEEGDVLLKEIKRVLKESGMFYLKTPNRHNYLIDVPSKILRGEFNFKNPKEHIHEYGFFELKKKIENIGFSSFSIKCRTTLESDNIVLNIVLSIVRFFYNLPIIRLIGGAKLIVFGKK